MRSGVFKAGPGSNRSFEYDTLSDQYARFLLEKILPEVGRTLNLTQQRRRRAARSCRHRCAGSGDLTDVT